MLKSKHSKTKSRCGGFSLVELLVVVSIFLIISSVTLLKQGKFSSDTLVTNTAYEVALAIREAQVYGVGSKQSGGSSKVSYGVNFEAGSEESLKTFKFFSEVAESDGTFSSVYSPSDPRFQVVKNISFNQDQKIKYFCGKNVNDSDFTCSDLTDLTHLNIAFVKPNLDAVMRGEVNASVVPFSEVKIVVESSLRDKCRTILVNWVGQINVKSVTPGQNGCSE